MNYRFFDYKYNIVEYKGQHYGSDYQTIYLIAALFLSLFLALLFRKAKKETIRRIVGWIGIAMTVLYVFKTLWESHYDVATGRGFNTYLLPFDTCSILMWASLIAGFGKGWFARWAENWLTIFGFVGGFANALFLQGLKYYPFFSFGAFYSMLWHAAMIFLAFWLFASGITKPEWKDILRAFGFHAIFSVLPIAINFSVSHMNWMLYDSAGGVPLVEKWCAPYVNTWKAVLIMAAAYFFIDVLLVALLRLIRFVAGAICKKTSAA